ncbi:MAG: DUF3667 domain-containing protein [Vicingaceae bacterium]|nr:DUF3667 domain-containing protein [Vicingaceae bacterium]
MQEINCSNCNTTINDAYCAHCGQKFVPKRVNIFTIFSDYVSQILSLEKSGFATFIKLITHPKKVIENYLNGYRNFYQSPGRLLFYFITVAGLHVLLVDKKLFGTAINVGSEFLSPQIILTALIIPFLSLVAYLAFIKQNNHKNFAEHLIAQTYLFSVFGMLFIILDDIISLFTLEIDYFSIEFLMPAILFWTALTFSKKRTWYFILLNFLLLLLVLVIFILLLILLGKFTDGGITLQEY